MDNCRRGDSPDEGNMRRQPSCPPSSTTNDMMKNNAEVMAHVPGQCFEDSIQVLPRVTCQLAQFTSSETDSSSSDWVTNSSESSTISPISITSSIGSISPQQVPAPQRPQHFFRHCPGSLTDSSSSDEETGSDEYSPISPIRPNSPISSIGSNSPQPRYSVTCPGQVIPEHWFIGPLPELAAMPEYGAICDWYRSDHEAHIRAVIGNHLAVTRSNVGPTSEITSRDEILSVNITCACSCSITSRPFRRFYRHLRSRLITAAQRIRKALHPN